MKVREFVVRRVVKQEQRVKAASVREALAIVEDMGEVNCRFVASQWRAKEVKNGQIPEAS